VSRFSLSVDRYTKNWNVSAVLLLGFLFISFSVLFQYGSELTFFFDEWDFVLNRSYNASDFLRPHNGHLSLLPVLVYNLLRSLFGIDSYVPFQVAGLLVHASVCVGVYAIGKRRSTSIAIVAALFVSLLGTGWQNIMWPFQIGMMGALSAGLWAIWECTKTEASPRRVALLCLISLLCAGGGIVAFATVGAITLYRQNWKSLTYLSVVGVMYLVWYLNYGVSQSVDGNLGKTPNYVYQSALGAASGITINNTNYGKIFLVVLVLLLAANIYRKQSILTAIAAIAMATFSWILTGVSRAHLQEPSASRYVYVGAVLLVVAFISLVPSDVSRFAVFPILVVGVFLVQGNLEVLKNGSDGLRDVSRHVRSSLTGIDLIPGVVTSTEQVDSSRAPQIDVRRYQQVSNDAGEIGFTPTELRMLPEEIRLRADNALFRFINELYSTIDVNSCNGLAPLATSTIKIEPGETLRLAPMSTISATFRWFTNNIETGTVLEMELGKAYQIQNRTSLDAPSLMVTFSEPKIKICG
jgi:hypothetical protein